MKNDFSRHAPIPLYPAGEIPFDEGRGVEMPVMLPYLLEGARSCVVIFPGGGYFQRSDDFEGDEIALAYNRSGFSAFVVHYRYRPYGGEAILQDAVRAIRLIRSRRAEFGIDPDRLIVCGFSAGGHLAQMCCQSDVPDAIGDATAAESSRPNAAVLCYPVTTFLDGTYPLMPEIFLREKKGDEALLRRFSAECSDMAAQGPTFIWASVLDASVDPMKNSVRMAQALHAHGIPYALHLFGDGGHGGGLFAGCAECGRWHAMSVDFLRGKGL